MKASFTGNFIPERFDDLKIGQLVIQNFQTGKFKHRYIVWKVVGLNNKAKNFMIEVQIDTFRIISKFTRKNYKFSKRLWKKLKFEILN